MSIRTDIDEVTLLSHELRAACKRVAPVWPLDSFVAVNPYLGMLERRFEDVAQHMRRVAGANMTMPGRFYVEALEQGRMTREDVAAALAERGVELDVDGAIAAARSEKLAPAPSVPTVADTLEAETDEAWVRFVTERVSAWAAGYFDEGQALWTPGYEAERGLFAAWREDALLDRTPEVMGAKGFRAAVAALPEAPLEAARAALARLAVPQEALPAYLHRLLMRVGGWAAYAARVVWDAELYEQREDDTAVQLLSVLLVWEVALLECFEGRGLAKAWAEARERAPRAATARDAGLERNLAFQLAFERAEQRRLVSAFAERPARPARAADRPSTQAVFCIDVRSEVFRRHLEATDTSVETLGFAGFFGFPIEYVPLAHERGGAQCPVLLTPAHRIEEHVPDAAAHEAAIARRRLGHEVKRAWTSFKMGAISCFSFVGPVGLAYLPKLFTDGFGLTRPVAHPDAEGLGEAAAARDVRLEPREVDGVQTGVPLEARIEMAAGALGAMSLTEGFARLVLIAGHGSTTVNNPHATGLDCGACGGRTGEANARVAAAILNDPAVRRGLAERGVEIPEDTFFLAGQHDTTTDEVTLFNRAAVPATHAEDLRTLERRLADAGRAARAERAPRLCLPSGADPEAAVLARSRDWAQVRPEWGLAGCSAFVVAPRDRTETVSLDGRSFLHSYVWSQDEGFGVLELIMTAPMVVASWISLQYYASTVDNTLFGAGNKVLHNVVGNVGVLEGNAGDLRVGLPWQSVHDGERLQHDPVRLNVFIEAPIEAMNGIIEKHEMVRNLLDNGWLNLFALDAQGQVSHRYTGGLSWGEIAPSSLERAA